MKRIFLCFLTSHLILNTSFVHAGCSAKNLESFNTFFSKWSSNKQFANNRTIYPLKTIKYDSGSEEPEPIRSLVTRAEVEKTPSFSEHIKSNALEYKLGSVTASKATVTVFKESTDWQYEYRFKNLKGCWYLYEFENQSL